MSFNIPIQRQVAIVNSKALVTAILRHYRDLNNRKKIMEQSILSLMRLSNEDYIESMMFSSFTNERVQSNRLSDRTAQVAFTYQEAKRKEVLDNIRNITEELRNLQQILCRFQNALDGLDKRQRAIVEAYYLNAKTMQQISDEYGLCIRTARALRQKAIDKMALTYDWYEKKHLLTLEMSILPEMLPQ